MNWTARDKKVASAFLKQYGSRADLHALQFLLKGQTKRTFSLADVKALVAEINQEPVVRPQPTELKKDVTPTSVKETCRGLINQIHSEILAAGIDVKIQRAQAKKDLPLECPITPILFLSDLHIGETIKVNGVEIFNLTIAEQWLDSIFRQVPSVEMAAYDLSELIVVLGGDIIDGELIYPAQAFATPVDAFGQVQVATKMIWNQLNNVAQYFDKVTVYCVPGNHGRTSKIHSQMSNFDNVLYYSLQLLASSVSDKIIVNLPHQMWMDFNVYQWNYHIRHIGVVQATTGNGARKTYAWMDGHNADVMLFGHYHSPEMFSSGRRRIFKNGALPPPNDFAENLGFLDGTGQWLIGVTPNNPVEFTKVLTPEVVYE